MYQNQHGRFTAVDPLLASGKSVNPQTFNRYAYTMNRPLILVDTDGLQAGAPVKATSVKISVRQDESPARGGTATSAVYDKDLAIAASAVATSLAQNEAGYALNRDLAFRSSKAFMDSVDADNIELSDVMDLVRERSYGTTGKDGSVILPDSVTTGELGANAGLSGGAVNAGISGTTGSSTYQNTAIDAKNEANKQNTERAEIKKEGGQRENNFVSSQKSAGAKIQFFDARGNSIGKPRLASENELRIIYRNAVSRGSAVATQVLADPKKERYLQ